MQVGDLISFKPIDFGLQEWSNPSIVLEEYPPPDKGLWVIWEDGDKIVIDEENYEIVFLTSS